MNSLRDRAIVRKAEELHDEARQLERISRHQPRVSQRASEARRILADCTLTTRSVDELRRQGTEDDDALAELTRRAA